MRNRGMYQPLRRINKNSSSIRRASLKILSALHWGWREGISCPLFPSPSWKTSSYWNEQAPYCTAWQRQQQLHRAAWLFRCSCHYEQRGNPVPETAQEQLLLSPSLSSTEFQAIPLFFISKAEMQGTASELYPLLSPSLKDCHVPSVSGRKCQEVYPWSTATAIAGTDWLSALPQHRSSGENRTRSAPVKQGHGFPTLQGAEKQATGKRGIQECQRPAALFWTMASVGQQAPRTPPLRWIRYLRAWHLVPEDQVTAIVNRRRYSLSRPFLPLQAP